MKKLISLLVVLAMLMAFVPTAFAAENANTLSGTIEIAGYENAEWTAPQDGYVQFTIDVSGAVLAVLNGFTPLAEGTDSITAQVTAGTTYGIYPNNVAAASVVTWEYVEAPAGGSQSESIPNGGALALGENNVTLTHATMPMMAPKWTYTATEAGNLTVTVSSINGNTMLGMPFGMGVYTLLAGESNGMGSNTVTVYMNANETINIAVLDTMDMTEVPAVINLDFAPGAPSAEKKPADYFAQDPNGNYIIESLANPVEIFVGNDDINYIYTAEFDGVLSVEYSDPLNNGIWYIVNGDNYYGTAPDFVSAGDEIIFNIWSGFEGVVSLTAGSGNTPPADEKNPADYFDKDDNNYYIIESLENPVEIFVGNDDITYTYTAESAGVVTVTPTVDGMTATNCWISHNDNGWDTSAAPVTVAAGDVVLINIWSGYEATVTLTAGGESGGGTPGGGESGGDNTPSGVPSGSALALGNNNVSITYAMMPMQAPYWTYTATEAGYLTVTVTSINGNSMLDMAFGRGMYTLVVGETDGMGTNTVTVYLNASDSVNIAVLDTIDEMGVYIPAVINLAFTAGEPAVEKDPADFFEQDADNNYVIESLANPVEIFVGNNDINYIYIAESAGVVTVTPTVDGMTATNCWISHNDNGWDTSASPVTVAAGDVVLINIWSGYEGTVTLTEGAGGGDEIESAPMSGEDVAVGADESLEIYYTPTTNGVLTIDISGTPGYSVLVQNVTTEDTVGLPHESSQPQAATYELEAGVEYKITLTGFSTDTWSAADATLTYEVTFEGGELTPAVEDLAESDVALVIGEQTVDLLPNAITTLYGFTATEAGVYTLTIPNDAIAELYSAAWISYQICDGNTLVFTATADGQEFLIGLTSEENSMDVTIAKTGSYTPPAQIEYKDYEATDKVVENFEEPENLVNLDISKEHTLVLGTDGFYHLGAANGPIVYVNLNSDQFVMANLLGAGAPTVMRGTYVDEEGNEHHYDFMSLISNKYYDYSREQDFHPLNTDLMIFLKAYGTAQGWYNENTSGFEAILSGDFLEESAWLAACYSTVEYVKAPAGNAQTGDPIVVAAAVALGVSSICGTALIAKKKEF